HSAYALAVFQLNDDRLEARRDGAARFEDRFDDVDLGKAAAEAGQFRADALALVADAVALDALRFFGVEEELAAALSVAGPRQGGLHQALVIGRGALAAETKLKFGRTLVSNDLHENVAAGLGQRGAKSIRRCARRC